MAFLRRRTMLLPSLLLAGITGAAIYHALRGLSVWKASAFDPDYALVVLYLLWLLEEMKISKRDGSSERREDCDSRSCLYYSLGQALVILSALVVPSLWHQPSLAHAIGIILFLGGIGCRLWAIRELGPLYSHRVCKQQEHRIIDSGPYKHIRHPAYAGMIAAHLGIVIYFANIVTALLFFLVFLPAIMYRIKIEERMLFEIDGYAAYAEARRRLLPGVW